MEDWLPIYDRTYLDGLYVAIGTSGNQFKNAAIAAVPLSISLRVISSASTTTVWNISGLDIDTSDLSILIHQNARN